MNVEYDGQHLTNEGACRSYLRSSAFIGGYSVFELRAQENKSAADERG